MNAITLLLNWTYVLWFLCLVVSYLSFVFGVQWVFQSSGELEGLMFTNFSAVVFVVIESQRKDAIRLK